MSALCLASVLGSVIRKFSLGRCSQVFTHHFYPFSMPRGSQIMPSQSLSHWLVSAVSKTKRILLKVSPVLSSGKWLFYKQILWNAVHPLRPRKQDQSCRLNSDIKGTHTHPRRRQLANRSSADKKAICTGAKHDLKWNFLLIVWKDNKMSGKRLVWSRENKNEIYHSFIIYLAYGIYRDHAIWYANLI